MNWVEENEWYFIRNKGARKAEVESNFFHFAMGFLCILFPRKRPIIVGTILEKSIQPPCHCFKLNLLTFRSRCNTKYSAFANLSDAIFSFYCRNCRERVDSVVLGEKHEKQCLFGFFILARVISSPNCMPQKFRQQGSCFHLNDRWIFWWMNAWRLRGILSSIFVSFMNPSSHCLRFFSSSSSRSHHPKIFFFFTCLLACLCINRHSKNIARGFHVIFFLFKRQEKCEILGCREILFYSVPGVVYKPTCLLLLSSSPFSKISHGNQLVGSCSVIFIFWWSQSLKTIKIHGSFSLSFLYFAVTLIAQPHSTNQKNSSLHLTRNSLFLNLCDSLYK